MNIMAEIFYETKWKIICNPFLVLILIEVTDLIFAADSIPAYWPLLKTHFIVYTSNVFAILGLCSCILH
jgi:tellurite resistance protein TerC